MRKFFAVLVIMTTLLTGCSVGGSVDSLPKVTTADESDSLAVIEALENADVITVKKDMISIGDHWTVSADGVKVADIKGQPLYMIGDTYSMFSVKGNLVGSEGEQFRLIERKAKLYDYNNEFVGQIDQEIFSLLYKFTFFDADMNKTGTMEQNFNLVLSADIKDNNGVVVWHFDKKLISLGAELTLERKGDSDIDAMSAVWMTVLANEISEASSSTSDSGSSRRG